MRQYVHATVIGTCQSVEIDFSDNWCVPVEKPNIDALVVGGYFAKNTDSSKTVILGMIEAATPPVTGTRGPKKKRPRRGRLIKQLHRIEFVENQLLVQLVTAKNIFR